MKFRLVFFSVFLFCSSALINASTMDFIYLDEYDLKKINTVFNKLNEDVKDKVYIEYCAICPYKKPLLLEYDEFKLINDRDIGYFSINESQQQDIAHVYVRNNGQWTNLGYMINNPSWPWYENIPKILKVTEFIDTTRADVDFGKVFKKYKLADGYIFEIKKYTGETVYIKVKSNLYPENINVGNSIGWDSLRKMKPFEDERLNTKGFDLFYVWEFTWR